MATKLITIDQDGSKQELRAVASALVQGALVGMPTETVYGLAGNALLPDTVRRIFAVKGRPQDNPLIVHLYDQSQLAQVAEQVPAEFYLLYEEFCPGPLTMVMTRSQFLPSEVSAGLDTVGIRFPAQRTARNLLRLAEVPVVAPSGNLSGRPSPTQAQHMLDDLDGKIEYILDDGPCALGVESTVLDLTARPPQILRPGVITAELILERTGLTVHETSSAVSTKASLTVSPAEGKAENCPRSGSVIFTPRSPGQKYRHYAPQAPIFIARGQDSHEQIASLLSRIESEADKRLGFFGAEDTFDALRRRMSEVEGLPAVDIVTYLYPGSEQVETATHELFAALREFDAAGVELILTPAFPRREFGIAYMDRLERAAESEEK
ncbi:MAG: L-threonylcarbamoyladenylate synthase [Saccharofermentanales bacterium]|jgi:L-threonylcarbamoyladenylate synthase